LSANSQMILPLHKCKALTKLKQEFLHVINESIAQVSFLGFRAKAQIIENWRVFDKTRVRIGV
jgi:hypothetical protein